MELVLTSLLLCASFPTLMVFVDAYYQKNWRETFWWLFAFAILVPLTFAVVKTQGLGGVIFISSLLPSLLLIKRLRAQK